MNLRQIRYFCEVVKTGNAAQAAKNLHVAPTAVSMQVSQLEDQLGGQLFDRSKRPMELTELGRFFYSKSIGILSSVNTLERDAKNLANRHKGWIGIGFTRSAMISFLPETIKNFYLENSTLQISLIEELSEYHTESIKSGKFHIGISRLINDPLPDDTIVYEKLFSDPFFAAIPVGNKLSTQDSIKIEDLDNQSFIFYPKDSLSEYSLYIKSLLQSKEVNSRSTYDAIEINTAISLVSAGLGCTIVGESVTKNVYKNVKFLPIKNIEKESLIYAAYLKNENNPLIETFLGHLQRLTR